MKKIINCPEQVILEMCHGMVLAHPHLEFMEKYKIMVRSSRNADKVTLISGGGSGHEPAHAGYVGTGMLDAAVCGDVFASPSQIQVYNALTATRSKKGTLLIIKNYSGDMMNFKCAAQLAQEDGIELDYVRVDDDIAVQDSLYTVGRRGVAGTVFVHKIAGAAAERGYDLLRVKALAEKAIANVRTIGFAETSCTVPAKGTPTFTLGEDEIEYGVGIHGEPGIRREPIQSASVLAKRMTADLLAELGTTSGSRVAVLVNGLGGTPLQELYVLNHCVQQELAHSGIVSVLTLVGNYMTSIDMAGASLSLLKLDDELQALLLDPCDTVGLHISKAPEQVAYWELSENDIPARAACYEVETDVSFSIVENKHITLGNLIFLVDAMSACIIKNEVPFCEMDSHAGDGDFGMSIAKGFRRLKEEWSGILLGATTIGAFLNECSLVIMENCGGASGPIWGSAFRAAARYAGEKTTLTAKEFAQLLQSIVDGIQATGERSFGRGAVVGDKTLLDALIPCAELWATLADSATMAELFQKGADAAVAGAKQTEQIVARMGRAGTVGERSLGYPDAGAHALGIIFSELATRINKTACVQTEC